MGKIFDISLPISDLYPAWPGESKPLIEKIYSIADGDDANVSRLEMGVHFATHVDAPSHFIEGGRTVENLDLNILNGPVEVVEIENAAEITAELLNKADLPAGTTRVIFKTKNSGFWDNPGQGFREDFTALSDAAAKWLIDRSVLLVGIDYLSIESFHSTNAQVHKRLLKAGVIVVEGLDLRKISPGPYHLHCLPLKIVGTDGAPARAILIQ